MKETDSTYDISFVVNGYDGEKTTQDSYVSDLKYRWEYKTEYWKWIKEFSAERVEYKNFEQWSGDTGYTGWASFSFYSEGPNLNITSYYEQSDDDWDDSNDILEVDQDLKRNDFDVPSYEEREAERMKWESQRDMGMKIARAAAMGDPVLEKYVELAFTQPDHRTISKKMKKTKAEVLEIEARLIVRIKSKLEG